MSAAAAPDWREVLRPGGVWSALVTCGSSPARAARHAAGPAYLALPYATEVALRGDWRLDRSVRLEVRGLAEVARLWAAGCTALCPAVQRAGIAAVAGVVGLAVDPLDDAAWSPLALALRGACRLVVVPDLRGWDRCPQVWADVCWALDHNMPVHVYAGGRA
jgi:hypothetical protein